jgi:hypothetical protein
MPGREVGASAFFKKLASATYVEILKIFSPKPMGKNWHFWFKLLLRFAKI